MDNNKYKCTNVGCCQSFKWPMHLVNLLGLRYLFIPKAFQL